MSTGATTADAAAANNNNSTADPTYSTADTNSLAASMVQDVIEDAIFAAPFAAANTDHEFDEDAYTANARNQRTEQDRKLNQTMLTYTPRRDTHNQSMEEAYAAIAAMDETNAAKMAEMKVATAEMKAAMKDMNAALLKKQDRKKRTGKI